MKKSIIALMGLFTLVACSDNSYQESDKINENEISHNPALSKGANMGLNGYESPYNDWTNHPLHYGIEFEFDIKAPVDLIEITPYVGPAYSSLHQSLLNNPHGGCYTSIPYPGVLPCAICSQSPKPLTHYINFLKYMNDVYATPTIKPLQINNGFTLVQDCYASIPVFPSNVCPNVPFIFDFGIPSVGTGTGPLLGTGESTLLAENSKIYFIEYSFNLSGQQFTGLLRHQLGDDTMTETALGGFGWNRYSNLPQINPIDHDGVIVVEHNSTKELAVAQVDNPTIPLNSEITVTDPATNIPYTLRFRNERSKIVIEFIP